MTEGNIKLGWRVVTAILGVLAVLTVLGALAPLLLGWGLSLSGVVRLLLTGWLAWLVYQGRGWARLVLVLMLLASAWSMFSLGQLTPSSVKFIPFGLSLLYLGCGVGLFAVPQVNTYFNYVRQ